MQQAVDPKLSQSWALWSEIGEMRRQAQNLPPIMRRSAALGLRGEAAASDGAPPPLPPPPPAGDQIWERVSEYAQN